MLLTQLSNCWPADVLLKPCIVSKSDAPDVAMPCVLLQEHEKVISIEDMTSSVELDYTDNPTLIVPSYTHQASLSWHGEGGAALPLHLPLCSSW